MRGRPVSQRRRPCAEVRNQPLTLRLSLDNSRAAALWRYLWVPRGERLYPVADSSWWARLWSALTIADEELTPEEVLASVRDARARFGESLRRAGAAAYTPTLDVAGVQPSSPASRRRSPVPVATTSRPSATTRIASVASALTSSLRPRSRSKASPPSRYSPSGACRPRFWARCRPICWHRSAPRTRMLLARACARSSKPTITGLGTSTGTRVSCGRWRGTCWGWKWSRWSLRSTASCTVTSCWASSVRASVALS